MNNKIHEVQKELDKSFHLYGYTNRIAVYGLRPSARRLIGKRKIAKDPRIMTKDRVPTYLLISYCVRCGNYGVFYKHEYYEDNSIMITTQIQIERQTDMPSKIECSPGQTTATNHHSLSITIHQHA